MTVLIAILSFVVAISILVAVHEFGHFWVARRLGFKVLRFSIGFGRPLWMRTGKDGVEYAVASLPIGGYVKMLDEREGPVAPEDLERSFTRRPVWQRVAVLLAGPALNFVFAVGAYWVLSMWGTLEQRPVVEAVTPGSYAAQAGLRPGDEIVTIGGRATPSAQAVMFELIQRVPEPGRVALTVRADEGRGADRTLYLQIDDAAERRRLTEPGALLVGLGFDYWSPTRSVVVGEVMPGSPAEQAGLQAGDRILAVDGRPVRHFQGFIREVAPRPGQSAELRVQREGVAQNLTVGIGRGRNEAGREVGQIGIKGRADAPADPAEVERMLIRHQYGPLAALWQGGVKTWEMSALTVNMLWSMVTGKVSVKNISGPINIAAFAGETARIGLKQFITFLAIVSISLGILNLLPIPLLDGGQIVYQLVEGVKGSPLSDRAQIFGQQVGIAALVLLMGLAFYNDITSRFLN
jgi:regulator of sigma E protease